MIKKILIILAVFVLLFTAPSAYADSKDRTHTYHDLTGGGTGSLDGSISGVSVGPKDQFIGTYTTGGVTRFLFYRVTTDSVAEVVPFRIRADDVGAGATTYTLTAIGATGFVFAPSANPTVTEEGYVAYNQNLDGLVMGDGTNTNLITSPFYDSIFIASPDAVDDNNSQPFWRNTTGTTVWVTGVTFIANQTGVSISIRSGVTQNHLWYAGSGVSDCWIDASFATISGPSAYTVSFSSGSTGLGPRVPLIYDLGPGCTPFWIEIQISGRKEGNYPL
uniref:Uncharacterized protein n=1 Tax=viral metagenome TaxID=1070528 RepID=A0A6H1ZLJ1_9ZZZZ